MVHIRWSLKNNVSQCAVPRCKNRIGPTYLGLEICWRCYNKHCDTKFLQRYARGHFSKAYVAGRFYRGWPLLVRTSEMGVIKLGDRVKMDPENCGAYSQFLKKGDGKIIGIHPMGQKDLGRTVQKWSLDDVGHLTVQCDNGLVIVIGPSRLVEINGYKRPEEGELHRRRARKALRIGPKPKRKSAKKVIKKARSKPKPRPKRRPRKKGSILDELWGPD